MICINCTHFSARSSQNQGGFLLFWAGSAGGSLLLVRRNVLLEEQRRTIKGCGFHLPFLSCHVCYVAAPQHLASHGSSLRWSGQLWKGSLASLAQALLALPSYSCKEAKTSTQFPKEKCQCHELSQLAPSIFYTLQSQNQLRGATMQDLKGICPVQWLMCRNVSGR